jgi:hypothetical protein
VVVNLSERASQARIRIPSSDSSGKSVHLNDVLTGVSYDRDIDELQGAGLYVELPPWGTHFLEFAPRATEQMGRAA